MNDQARLSSQDLKAKMDSFGVSGLMRAIMERKSCRDIAPLALAAPDIDRFFTLPIPARLNPLCYAILTGQPAQTELLLSLGARLDVRDMQWNTPCTSPVWRASPTSWAYCLSAVRPGSSTTPATSCRQICFRTLSGGANPSGTPSDAACWTI